jgi:hypothetical protein
LISARVIRPGPVTVVKRVAHAREVARQETFDRLAHEFTDERRAGLDGLLVVDAGIVPARWRGYLDTAAGVERLCRTSAFSRADSRLVHSRACQLSGTSRNR